MKAWIVVLAIAFGAPVSSPALFNSAGEDTGAPKKAATEDLVRAAKEAKSKRKQPSTKVITNADVKKSKGKLIVLDPADQPPVEKKPLGLSPLAQQDKEYRQRLETREKIAAAETRIAALQRELESIEQRYYEESDPDRRDKVIRKQFEDTKKKLAEAVAELELLKPESQEPTPDSQQ